MSYNGELADIAARYHDSPDGFPEKRILWIGSESYVAPAITVLQGLDLLGYEIYTPYKPNINSVWCNRPIDQNQIENMKFDLVISAAHWGTDYPAYHRFGLLNKFPKVMIDGDDAAVGTTWQSRYEAFCDIYGSYPVSKGRKKRERFKQRWMAPLDGYTPDVLFTMQKQFGSEGIYIPSGIHREYFASGLNARTESRDLDFTHIEGPGVWRKAMSYLIELGILPNEANVFNGTARGEPLYDQAIRDFVVADRDWNVHSWHRWVKWSEFYEVLNRSKILIHPGIDFHPFWDCKRPYEGWACGCLVLLRQPSTDVREYPPTSIWNDAVYASDSEFEDKANFYFIFSRELDEAREESYNRALKYLTPEPMARYFLGKVAENV